MVASWWTHRASPFSVNRWGEDGDNDDDYGNDDNGDDDDCSVATMVQI